MSLILFEKIFGIKMQERRENTGDRSKSEEALANADLDDLLLTQEANQQI